jgi:uncharacterized protein DUF1353
MANDRAGEGSAMIKTSGLIAAVVAVVAIVSVVASPCNDAAAEGRYLDELILLDVGDGRQFKLVSEYRYSDSRNTLWTVPKDTIVDGASIPSYLWSIVGGPWEGKYRNASVIHDYFFDRKHYDSDSVHWVFYDAMITSGVGTIKAKVMYFAVLRFNPAWKAIKLTKAPCPPKPAGFGGYRCYPVLADEVGTKVVYQQVTPKFDADELRATTSLIERQDPPLEEIERLAKARRGF